jgi:hypothetical protein
MRMMLLAVALLAAPGYASAQSVISGGEFQRRAEPLLKKSWISLVGAKEPKMLMQQFADAGERVRKAQDADRTEGRKPATCLPPKGKAKIDIRQFLAFIRTLPGADQAKPIDHALVQWSRKSYPCPAG